MRELDEPVLLADERKEPQYLVPESVYEYNHPEVIYYTNYFSERAGRKNVFSNIDTMLKNNKTLISAQKFAGLWYEFSKFVPSFIAKAVSLTTNPEHQHYLIQIAYDELGAQDKNTIHSKLFLEALEKAEIEPRQTSSLLAIREMLSFLNETLEKTKTPSHIIGLLLSFEIIAENNIETVFRSLSVDNHREEVLSASLFFKVHRINEIEHIRHSIANFLRFSNSPQEIAEAKDFFDAGIIFWRNFWDKAAEVMACE